MSYITEIWLDFKLKKDTPDFIIFLLKSYINESFRGWMPLSNHPFFRTKKWDYMFASMIYYEDDKPFLSTLKSSYQLHIHTDINYEDGEIDQFIDWLKPHIKGRRKKQYLGWYKRDGDRQQTNIYLER